MQRFAHSRWHPALIAFLMLFSAGMVWGQTHAGWHRLAGVKFKKALPRSFYLEGNAIPIERYHAVLLQKGPRQQVLIGLLATSGYSSDIRQKYIGMLISEMPIKLGAIHLGVGSFGFGLSKAPGAHHALIFHVYNQAGQSQGTTKAVWDAAMRHPTPLRVLAQGTKVLIFIGRHKLVLQ